MQIILVILWIFCPFVAASIARSKHRSPVGWFFLALFVGPFAWAVALLPALEPREEAPLPAPVHEVTRAVSLNEKISSLTKTCPACGETIKTMALKCRFCGESFDPKDVKTLVVAQFEKKAVLEDRLFKWCPKCKTWDATIAPFKGWDWTEWCPNCKKTKAEIRRELCL